MSARRFDYVIFGGGLFGLYAANLLTGKGMNVALVDADAELFGRASRINQARIHLGYHYPRSVATARASALTFDVFQREFRSAVNESFTQIYAISNRNSYTSAAQFVKFCEYLDLPVKPVSLEKFFNPGAIEAAFETHEYAFDANELLRLLLEKLKAAGNFTIFLNERLSKTETSPSAFSMLFESGLALESPAVLNAAYSGINEVLARFGFQPFDIKYEISEVALYRVSPALRRLGITVMDGPFFSTMPYGHTEFHSLTAVEYTPRRTSHDRLPRFICQSASNGCAPDSLNNCNLCPDRPSTSAPYMEQLAKRYLRPSLTFARQKSLFAMKAILHASEIDDSRPTLIKISSEKPKFLSVLSGKINTIHELDTVLP